MSRVQKHDRPGPYQLFMLILCLFAIVILPIEALVPISRATRQIFGYMDWGVCVVFLIDFVLSLARAPRRWQYFYRWGWLDLLSSIPTVPALRIGRVARVIRVIRLLRSVRATRVVASFVIHRRSESAFLAVGLVTILVVTLSAISILHYESVPQANIKSARDAMWWAMETVTTVGYGDLYPVTAGGRAVAAILMVTGVGLFGTFAAFVAAWFLQPSSRRESAEIEELEAKIDHLTEILEKQGRMD